VACLVLYCSFGGAGDMIYIICCAMSFGFRCSLDFFRFGLSGFVNVTTAHQRV